MNPIALAKDLIAIPSPSGQEREIGLFLAERLRKHFRVTTQPIGDRFNILATAGEPKLLLTTHMDTVPGQLPVHEDEEFLYGRGACDTKGIIAAMVCAAEEAAAEGLTGFGLLFDVSEETDFSGIHEAVKLVSPDAVIVGEPTGLRVAVGQKGLLGVKVRCTGKAAPGATPEQGVSAIEQLIRALGELTRAEFPPHETLGRTTINIGIISGGTAANIVPDKAEAFVELRITAESSEVLDILRRAVTSGFLDVQYSFDPVLTADTAFLGNLQLPRTVVPFFTEMYFWPRAIVLGPGDYSYAHTDKERIAKKDIVMAAACYRDIIRANSPHKREA